MFESIPEPQPAERLRAVATAPIAAFVFAQFYFSLYPLLARVPPWLFWFVAAITGAGAAWGFAGSARLAWRYRRELGWRGVVWLAIAVMASLVCGRLFLGLIFPWL